MAQKYTLDSSATSHDRLADTPNALVQLSDGTAVWIQDDGSQVSSGHRLYYSSDHSTPNLVAAIGSLFNPFETVVRDNLDNVYVLGLNNNVSGVNIEVRAFTKGAGYTWTAQTMLNAVVSGAASPLAAMAAVWCNTGGGTNSKGHIMVVGTESATSNGVGALWYAIIDAGVALAGAGTLFTASGTSPTFFGATTTATGQNIDIAQDGFGATSGIAAGWKTSTTLTIGKWAVNSSGALSTNTNITTTASTGTMSASTKVRVARYASDAYAVAAITPTNSSVSIARYSSTALLTAPAVYGAVTNVDTSLGAARSWDITVDPVTANRVWLYCVSTGTTTTILRVACDLGSGVSWAGSAITDDTSVGSGANSTIRAVKHPISLSVDWQTFNTNSGTFALLGDFTFFNTAPTIAYGASSLADASFPSTATPTLTAYVTDPDSSQTLTVTFEVASDAGFSSIVYTGTATAASPQTAGAVSKTTTALTKGALRYWRARVSDGSATSANTATRTFTIYDDPTVVIGASTPATTTSTGGPTLNVGWTYAQGQSLAEAFYRVQVQTNGGATTYYDTGTLAGPATAVALDAVALGIPTDTTGTALQVVVTVTAATTSTVVSATKAFDIQWGVVTVGIVSPSNGAIIATTGITAQWTFASTRSKLQGSYRIRLMIASTGSVLLDTGFVTSAATSAVVAVTLVDGSTYSLEVTLKNDQGVLGT